MLVITPGYSYQLETTDTVTYPTGYQPFQFVDVTGGNPGVIDSLEIIDMMIDRYLHFAEYDQTGALVCSIAYRLAAKAEAIVKSYIDDVE